MSKVYGGLLFENLVAQDKYLALQLRLFEKGLTQGMQLRMAHPSFTPSAEKNSLEKYFSVLPAGMEIVIHLGAENAGVDFGLNYDERGVYYKANRQTGISWEQWNKESLQWGYEIAGVIKNRIPENFPLGVVHPGYGKDWLDNGAINRIIKTLINNPFGDKIALENCPPIVDKNFGACGDPQYWSRNKYWAMGGIPFEMYEILAKLGPEWKCLIDFTHLFVMVNQSKTLRHADKMGFKNDNERVVYEIDNFLSIPHWPVCHFSGCPPTLIDNHDHLAIISSPIKEALRNMDTICLEIPYYPDNPELTEAMIEMFYESYLK